MQEIAQQYPELDLQSSNFGEWLDIAKMISSPDFKVVGEALQRLEVELTLRSYLSGYKLSLADFIVWGALKG